jgi:hypothetical protein
MTATLKNGPCEISFDRDLQGNIIATIDDGKLQAEVITGGYQSQRMIYAILKDGLHNSGGDPLRLLTYLNFLEFQVESVKSSHSLPTISGVKDLQLWLKLEKPTQGVLYTVSLHIIGLGNLYPDWGRMNQELFSMQGYSFRVIPNQIVSFATDLLALFDSKYVSPNQPSTSQVLPTAATMPPQPVVATQPVSAPISQPNPIPGQAVLRDGNKSIVLTQKHQYGETILKVTGDFEAEMEWRDPYRLINATMSDALRSYHDDPRFFCIAIDGMEFSVPRIISTTEPILNWGFGKLKGFFYVSDYVDQVTPLTITLEWYVVTGYWEDMGRQNEERQTVKEFSLQVPIQQLHDFAQSMKQMFW